MPSYRPIRWTKGQVERLERAVNAYNDAIDAATKAYGPSGVSYLLPQKVELTDEIDSITTASQLNMRVKSLNRINKPGALDIDVEHQMTNYEYHEGIVAKATVNRWRIQRIKAMGGEIRWNAKRKNWDMSAFTRQLVNESSLMPYGPDVDLTRERVDAMRKRAMGYSGGNRDELVSFYANYRQALTNRYYSFTAEYNEVISILDKLMAADTAIVNDVMYSYDEYGAFDYIYDEYDRTPLKEKALNILSYWRGIKNKYNL